MISSKTRAAFSCVRPVAAGAACSALDDDLQTPLHCAVANGHVEAVERLTARLPCAEMHVADKYKMVRAAGCVLGVARCGQV